MAFRLKSLTAVCLSLLYGIVGLTGESLHYLAQDFGIAFVEYRELADSGYFHSHGSHDHVHFHRHTHAELESNSTQGSPSQKQDTSPEKDAVEQFLVFHQEHACPLLTLVSKIKLGYSLVSSTEIESHDKTSVFQDYLTSLNIKPLRAFLVRGPPTLA